MRDILSLIRVLGIGVEHARHGDVLARDLELQGSGELRFIVNKAASVGIPVCSGLEGYWLAANQDEIDSTLQHRRSRVEKQLQAIRGLEKARPVK